MIHNVGKTDKLVRWILGLSILTAGILLRSWWGLIGIVPILTATIGYCPLYLPFGINTCSLKNRKPR